VAKPTQYATSICLVLTVIALAGMIIGLLKMNPLITIILLIPTVAYEVYRTEGKSTTLASWLLLLVFAAITVLFIFNINYDLSAILGISNLNVGGYPVPLGEIRVVGPAIVAVLAAILFFRTRGVYTKWLAVVILVGSLVVIYIIAPAMFGDVLAPFLSRLRF